MINTRTFEHDLQPHEALFAITTIVPYFFCFFVTFSSSVQSSSDFFQEVESKNEIFTLAMGFGAMRSVENESPVLRKIREKTDLEGIASVAWSPDGSMIAVSGRSLSVQLLDSKSLSVSGVFDQPSSGSGKNNVSFSGDGLYLASGPGVVNLWSLSSGKVHVGIDRPDRSSSVKSIVFSPNGKMIIILSQGDKTLLTAYSVNDGSLVWQYQPEGVLGSPLIRSSVLFSTSGAYVVASTGERAGEGLNFKMLSRLLFIDAGHGSLKKSINDVHSGYPTAIAISASENRIATGTTTGSKEIQRNRVTGEVIVNEVKDPVRVWDINSSHLLTEFAVSGAVRALIFSKDDHFLICSHDDSPGGAALSVWDLAARRLVQKIERRWAPTDLAVSPDGKELAVVGGSVLTIYEIEPPAEK